MSFLDSTINTLNDVLTVLNGHAFGTNVRYQFSGKPIGLFAKSYGFMLKHISRNIGSMEYTYDGFGTPIGELANPYYNTHTTLPWFKVNPYKEETANYIEYIRNVYGASLSITNINEGVPIPSSLDSAESASIDTGSFWNDVSISLVGTNPNGLKTDTMMAESNGNILKETLMNAMVINSLRDSSGHSISSGIRKSFGAKGSALLDNDIFNISSRRSLEDGRYATLNPLDISSPIGSSGTLGDVISLSDYNGFYEAMSEKQRSYLHSNIQLNRYHPRLTNPLNDNPETKISDIRGKGYLGSIGMAHGHELGIDNGYSLGINGTEFDPILVTSVDKSHARYLFTRESSAEAHYNTRDAVLGDVYVYAEKEAGNTGSHVSTSFNAGTAFGRYTAYNNLLTVNDMLKKTNDAFRNAKYGTLIARFHTSLKGEYDLGQDTTQTAVSKQYGLSHGRNLLKVTPDSSEGYENPYCRVWTYHHQYHRLLDAIRPFGDTDKPLYADMPMSAQHGVDWGNGRERLHKYGVINPVNGLVNLSPTDGPKGKVSIKNCMFSIENLAWKDAAVADLDEEQKGPFGGRIMWFPPYGINFNETVNVEWNKHDFIGRGEPIYTYTNTTRSGQLEFMLLIDHPSVLNYWENKGRSVTNSVDVVDDPEQNLLRFFAGCDDLSNQLVNITEPEPIPVVVDDPIPTPNTRQIRFYVFYPNNYSGVDDRPNYAIEYLLNGVGTWKTAGGSNVEISFDETTISRTNGGKIGKRGGYEVRPGLGISCTASNDVQNEHIFDITKVGDMDDYIPINTQSGESMNPWWKRKYYYRVDNAYKNQILQKDSYIDKTSYGLNALKGQPSIMEHYQINGDDLFSLADVYIALKGSSEAKKTLAGAYDESKANDFRNIIEQCSGIESIEVVGKASVQGYNELNTTLQRNRARTAANWLAQSPLIKSKLGSNNILVSVGGVGGKGPGINNDDASDKLNKLYRCAEVTINIKTESTKTLQNTDTIANGVISETGGANGGESFTRSVSSNTQNNSVIANDITFTDSASNREFEEKRLKSLTNELKLKSLSSNMGNFILNLKHAERHGEVSVNGVFGAVEDFVNGVRTDNITINSAAASFLRQARTENANVNELHNGAFDSPNSPGNSIEDTVENTLSPIGNSRSVGSQSSRSEVKQTSRPDSIGNEGRFFELLTKEEPFLHNKISDKIKYFDPAFHSVSPEGFNARLTFLHQCTRQGPTIASSDSNVLENTANNLSFGRPPVCILRIGDFYYTKILIRNLAINYDPLVWDFNHEGIGVMPMMARVSISFEFLGGSSLEGHITRLQNALSFNYYANTEVYDQRSELATYDNDGRINNFKSFTPS